MSNKIIYKGLQGIDSPIPQMMTTLADWIPCAPPDRLFGKDERLTGPRIISATFTDSFLRSYYKNCNKLQDMAFRHPRDCNYNITFENGDGTAYSGPKDDERCECGSGNDAMGPGHSDWCKRYLV